MNVPLLALGLLATAQDSSVRQLQRDLQAAIARSEDAETVRLAGELARVRSPESLRALSQAARQLWPRSRDAGVPDTTPFPLVLACLRGMIGGAFVPVWVETLRERIPPLRAAAVDALAAVRDAARPDEIDAAVYGIAGEERDPQVLQSLRLYVQSRTALTPAGIDGLILALESPDRDLRILAVQRLSAAVDPEAQERIELALANRAARETDSWVQAYTVYLMKDHSWASQEAIQSLARAVPRTREIDLRIALLETLAGARNVTDELLEAIRAGLRDGRCPVVAAAAQTMRRLDVRSTMPELIDALRDAMPHLREELCDVLRAITGFVYRNHSGWTIWWETFQESWLARTYEPPENPPPDVGGTVEEPGRRTVGYCPRCGAIPTFFGAPIDSLHVAFVVDRSGSMGMPCPWRRDPRTIERHPPQIPPEPPGSMKMDVLKWELQYAMALMPNYSVVNLTAYDAGLGPWRPSETGPFVVNAEVRRSAVQWVNSLCPGGDTNIQVGLQWAFRQEGIDTVFLLSDGQSTVGDVVASADILAAVRGWQEARAEPLRIHTVFLGAPEEVEGIQFMSRLAAENDGRFVDCSH